MSQSLKRKVFIVIGGIIVLLFVGVILSLFSPSGPPVKATTISPLQKTLIGQTTASDIEKLAGVQKKEILPSGETRYELKAFIPQRPDEVRTKDNIVVFERIDVPQDPKAMGYAEISQMTRTYGKPEKVIQGSAFFGPFVSTYIYGTRGFAFIGNPHTDEVYELQLFTPMTAGEYITKHGSDIKEGPPPEEPLW